MNSNSIFIALIVITPMIIGALAWGTLQFLEDEQEPALTELEQRLSERVGQLEARLDTLQQPKQDVKSLEEARRAGPAPDLKLERFHQKQEERLAERPTIDRLVILSSAVRELEAAIQSLPDVSPSSENEASELRELRYAVCLLKQEIKPRDIPRKICR